MLTVKELLFFLNLAPYTHVLVKEYVKGEGVCGLGGGTPEEMSKRYSNYYVFRTFVLEEKFVLVVKQF